MVPDEAALLEQPVLQASPGAAAWIASARASARAEREFFLAFALAPRQVGRAELDVPPASRAAAARLRPGWKPWRWSVDQAARAWLVLQLPAADATAWLATLDRLFSTAGLQELVALYQALPLLPHGELLAERAAEGIRSSMKSVFEAVALENAYPQAHLAQEPWNQMVLKCLFMGSDLDLVVGLDARANAHLARMLVDYAHERWAAKRAVDPLLWRGVGRFADAAAVDDLARVLASGEAAPRPRPRSRSRPLPSRARAPRWRPRPRRSPRASRRASSPGPPSPPGRRPPPQGRGADVDRSDGATLAFKLAGIYVLVEAVKLIPTEAPNIAALLADPTQEHLKELWIVGGALVLSSAVLGLIGWLLIARARRMADRMFGGGQATIDFSGQVVAAQVVAFSVIGAVMLADGLPKAAGVAADLLRLHEGYWVHLRAEASALLIVFLELTFGYWLLFRPRSGARLWLAWSDARSAPRPLARSAAGAVPRLRRCAGFPANAAGWRALSPENAGSAAGSLSCSSSTPTST